jgi:Yip1 domain
MGTVTTAPAAEAQPPINHFGRLIGVFFTPKETLASIAERPSWVMPVVVMTVLGIGVGFALNQRVNWRDVASKRIEESSRASQLSPEQKEQQLAMSEKISPAIAYCIGAFVPILLAVIVGGVMLGAFNLLGGANANFKVSMGIVAHAYFVSIISSLLFVLILYLRPPGTVDLENPVAANVAAFLPDGTAKWLVTLGTAIDLFSFWIMILIAIGFAAFNPKKLKFGSAFGIVLSVWAVYEIIRVGFAFIFS